MLSLRSQTIRNVKSVTKAFQSIRSMGTITDILGKKWNDETGYPPQFMVREENGFLPRELPMEVLPEQFAALESLLQRMPIKTREGKEGLLVKGEFGPAVLKELPDYTEDVKKIEDSALLTALFRDYTFAASSNLLEPCDIEWRNNGGKGYGLGRQSLPPNLARPLTIIAEKIGAKPFMEYALSYALYNWALVDKFKPIEYSNMKLIRTFDGSDAEHGFILVHVAMVAYSGKLVKAAKESLDAVFARDRKAFDKGMADLLDANVKLTRPWKLCGNDHPLRDITASVPLLWVHITNLCFLMGALFTRECLTSHRATVESLVLTILLFPRLITSSKSLK